MENKPQKTRIAILGSTGSIGTQALDVIERNPEYYSVEVLTANNNADLLIQQALKFDPNVVVIANKSKYQYVADALANTYVKVYAGEDALCEVVAMETVDIVLGALVGYSGLLPTISAIKAGKEIALANKETLVVAGALVTELAQKYKTNIVPVDSEHSAIFQCLFGEGRYNRPEKIILTASGGPFRTMSRAELEHVTPSQALKHPNWSMGAKVTIDSASMMNKGLEAIEAHWLFNVEPEKIDILVHPQSIVHSMVQFEDGAIKAQLGTPDMRLPIQYAFSFPYRLKSTLPRLDFAMYPSLTFEKPDFERFPNLQLAFDAMNRGGNLPCIMNAANEIAVAAFLQEKIGFLAMSDVIAKTMSAINFIANPTYEDFVTTNAEARKFAEQLI